MVSYNPVYLFRVGKKFSHENYAYNRRGGKNNRNNRKNYGDTPLAMG